MKKFILTLTSSFAILMILSACSAEIKSGDTPQPVAPEGKKENLNPLYPLQLITSKSGEEKYNNFVINSFKTHYAVVFDYSNPNADVELSFGLSQETFQGCGTSKVTRTYSWMMKNNKGEYVSYEPLGPNSYFFASKGQSYSLMIDVAGADKCYSYGYDFIVKERSL